MTRPHYCDIRRALVSVHIRSAEHSPELREERFCSEGRQCPYHLAEFCPLSGAYGSNGQVGEVDCFSNSI